MSPLVLAALISSIPQLIQLVQSMIAQLNTPNSQFTEADVLAVQSQVATTLALANKALLAAAESKDPKLAGSTQTGSSPIVLNPTQIA